MKHLIRKEFSLAMHPTAPLFLFLSAMLLIPSYPYYVVFFYTGLAIFFTCLGGRENHDIAYTLSLPVRKADVVRARFAFAVLLQLMQIVTAILFALLRGVLIKSGNDAGMDANIALFGLALLMMGLFNLVFFTLYYRDVEKVGTSFLWASVAVFAYILLAEACTFVVPFFRDKLDTPDPAFLTEKLAVLAIGAAAYAVLTAISLRKCIRSFEKLDL